MFWAFTVLQRGVYAQLNAQNWTYLSQGGRCTNKLKTKNYVLLSFFPLILFFVAFLSSQLRLIEIHIDAIAWKRFYKYLPRFKNVNVFKMK